MEISDITHDGGALSLWKKKKNSDTLAWKSVLDLRDQIDKTVKNKRKHALAATSIHFHYLE